METCVLIPQELSLVITSPNDEKHERRKYPDNISVNVWTNSTISQGTLIYPFQGTIRLDTLDIHNYLDYNDVSEVVFFQISAGWWYFSAGKY